MKITNLLLFVFFTTLFVTSCGSDDSDDTVDPNLPTDCKLNYVSSKIDETTRLGLFDVLYNNAGQISSAGLQEYIFSYDADGNVTRAFLPDGGFNPQVKVAFTYTDGKISKIEEIWGPDATAEIRYVFTPTYDGEFVDKLSRTGLGPDVELDYDFDANGNPLKWTEPTFENLNEFTFDTDNNGLFDGLTHNQAFAYSIALNQPFFLFENTVTSRIIYNSDGTIEEQSDFIDINYNNLGFQTSAEDPNGSTYFFEYDCE